MVFTQNLIEQHVPFANKLAHKRKRTLPRFIDLEDLKSAAYMGLVEAAGRYNPEMGVAFKTFSYRRIVGAMQDFLREQRWLRGNGPSHMVSLDTTFNDEDCALKDTIEAKPEDQTEACFEVLTMNLDDQAKQVLKFYFIDEYSMKEVGERFNVSESRICQLIKSYKTQIRESWSSEDLAAEMAA